jgi:rod shape-determining protein MreD
VKRKSKTAIFLLLLLGQIAICRSAPSFRFNVDLTYLIIVFVAVRSSFLKVMTATTLLGLLMDYLSGGIMGVFSFSRTLTTYFLMHISRYIDFRKNVFIFFLIFVSLVLSNTIANLFFTFAFGFRLTARLIFIQPLLTAAFGTLIVGTAQVKRVLDVY